MSSVVSLSAYSVSDELLSRAPVRLNDAPASYSAVNVAASNARCRAYSAAAAAAAV